MTIASRFCFAGALVLTLAFGTRALAAPAWYVSGSTANLIDPNLPDFYQHQNLVPSSGTNAGFPQSGWEAGFAGGRFWTAYADAFYDLTTQGYTSLFKTNPTPASPGWYSAIYGAAPATSASSDIAQLVSSMPNDRRSEPYLTMATSGAKASLSLLLSNTFSVNANGTVNCTNSFGSLAMAGTSSSIFAFTNSVIKNLNGEVLYEMGPGTTTLTAGTFGIGRPQGRWWSNFHEVAVAGLNLSSSTSFVADPDTNLNVTTADGSGPMQWVGPSWAMRRQPVFPYRPRPPGHCRSSETL